MTEDTLEQPALSTRFVTRERPRLVALAARVVGSDAEDVVQEAMLKLAEDPVNTRPGIEVAAWLRRVCLNLAINRRRDLARWQARGERGGAGVPAPSDDPEGLILRMEEQNQVRVVLDRLSERHQMILLLRYGGHSYAEIAATLDMPIGSVGTTLARAEQAFRAAYTTERP